MSNDLKKYFCPRLIDFVIIVGCKEPATPSQLLAKHLHQQQLQQQHYEQSLPPEMKQQYLANLAAQSPSSHNPQLQLTQMPELLRRYPLDDHQDFMLPQDVIYFCQPEGCVNINCSNQEKANSNKDTASFIFSLTEKDSARVRYGICINFFRPIEKKNKDNNSNNSTYNIKKKIEVNEVADTDDEPAQTATKKKRNKKARDVKYTHTLTSLCIISHHPFFSIFRECLNILRRIIEACHARSLKSKSKSASDSNANDTVWGILTGSCGNISSESISQLVACEIREIETWILRLLSAPVPLPGQTRLIVDILPNEPPMLFALPDHTRFSLVDFPLHLPLELLGVDLCIKVFTLILLENKVSFIYNLLLDSLAEFI